MTFVERGQLPDVDVGSPVIQAYQYKVEHLHPTDSMVDGGGQVLGGVNAGIAETARAAISAMTINMYAVPS